MSQSPSHIDRNDTAHMETLIAAAQTIATMLKQCAHFKTADILDMLKFKYGIEYAAGDITIRQVYDIIEVAQVITILDRYSVSFGNSTPVSVKSQNSADILDFINALTTLSPTQSYRDETQISYQQFSTPAGLAYLAVKAAKITSDDCVLEPSAGTGLMASMLSLMSTAITVNELEPSRARWLHYLFPNADQMTVDAAQIHGRLNQNTKPSVVVMNPPFVRSAGQFKDGNAAARHVYAALLALQPGGRCSAILPVGFSPTGSHAASLETLSRVAMPVFSCSLSDSVYAKHGTHMPLRLVVFDKPTSRQNGTVSTCAMASAIDLYDLDAKIDIHCPIRLDLLESTTSRQDDIASTKASLTQNQNIPVATAQNQTTHREKPSSTNHKDVSANVHTTTGDNSLTAQSIQYSLKSIASDKERSDGLYQDYTVKRMQIIHASVHPTPLVESSAMHSVTLPLPRYVPKLPARVLTNQQLSDAQLECIIMAGSAHSVDLPGHFILSDYKKPVAVSKDHTHAFQYRQGFFLGDGTGCGKGRQVAGIIMDRWLLGSGKHVWVSQSDKLIEDARRDWTALYGLPGDIVPLSRFKPGTAIPMNQAILFTTYATLRGGARGNKQSRLDQILDWLGTDFDGIISFDESHAMGNAGGELTERGQVKGSLQGVAGIALQQQVPRARVVYVSATGATTVNNLAYAERLGLWGHDDAPFETRTAFITAMESGGVAAMELVARDLKAQGLYMARALSFAGVEYDILEHELTRAQIAVYDAYCAAFEVIHSNLQEVLETIGIKDPFSERKDSQALGAALSAFESTKQRFFNALLTSMKCPSLFADMETQLSDGHAVVIQLISTAEALLAKKLGSLSNDERASLDIDLTPRDQILHYLTHAFPTQLMSLVENEDGSVTAHPVFDATGRAVVSPEAITLRTEMLELLGSLPPEPAVLDQIIQKFGKNAVAEITGRSKRLIIDSHNQQHIENRPASSNILEAQSFMNDSKRILVFSQAGGTGRSYHADLSVKNQRRRVHYLLEAGWRADVAIQGLGRTQRTNQACAPLYRPVTTNVKAEKRFTSTIARRLDSLGALTRGQRQTGGQGMFRSEDNLESSYAKDALRHWFTRLHQGKIEAIGIATFCKATGLVLTTATGALIDRLPSIQRWLNRLLALPIALQNAIFEEYEDLLGGRVQAAIDAGTYDKGIETIHAQSVAITNTELLRTDPLSKSETNLVELTCTTPIRIQMIDDVLRFYTNGTKIINEKSGNAALLIDCPSRYTDEGLRIRQVALVRPRSYERMSKTSYDESNWHPSSDTVFDAAWTSECETHKSDVTKSNHFIITGLILPIWKDIGEKDILVRRVQTNTGETLLGPDIGKATAFRLKKFYGVGAPQNLSAETVWSMIMDDGLSIACRGGVQLRRSMNFGNWRLEIKDFPAHDLSYWRTKDTIVEIINSKTRIFVEQWNSTDMINSILRSYPMLDAENGQEDQCAEGHSTQTALETDIVARLQAIANQSSQLATAA